MSATTGGRDSGADAIQIVYVPASAPVPPVITVQPQRRTVTAGEIATFSVIAAGTEPLAYQWRINGQPLPGAINATLVLSNVQPGHVGQYSVVVSNSLGSVISSNAILAVSLSATSSTYDLARDFSLNSNPNGVWTYGAMEALAGALRPFAVRGLVPDDAGSTIEFWQLVAEMEPSIYHNPGCGTAVIGGGGQGVLPAGSVVLYSGADGALNGFGVVRFTVPAAGATEDGQYAVEVTVRPLFDGPLAGDTDFHVVRNGEELFRRDLAPNESASYSDTLSLTAGDTIDFVVGRGQDRSGHGSGLKIEATITALGAGPEPPIVTGQPQDVTVGVGETASFGVVTSGNPAPTFQWLFNGAPLAGETNSSLVLSNVQPSQAGNYAVIAANAAGSATSSNAVLTVMPLPECVPVVPALVAWWPFDGTANDLFGTNDGAVIDTPVFTSGQVQEGLRFVLGSAVRVPASPSLDLGAGSGLTLDLWIKPSASDLARQSPLIEWTDNRSICLSI